MARKLGVSTYILDEMGVGRWDNEWHFPMFDENNQIIGIKIRNLLGEKWCLKKSKLGICKSRYFNPQLPAYICEGESDTAAMLSKGYNAIGRPGATSPLKIVLKLLKDCPEINIMADNDSHGQGWNTARHFAKVLYENDSNRRIYLIIHNMYKDVRAWINSGDFSHFELTAMKMRFEL